jgi:hypothetical protein
VKERVPGAKVTAGWAASPVPLSCANWKLTSGFGEQGHGQFARGLQIENGNSGKRNAKELAGDLEHGDESTE